MESESKILSDPKEEKNMKKFVKLLCVLLAMITMISLLPMAALASEGGSEESAPQNKSKVTVKAVCYTSSSHKKAAGTYSTKVIEGKDSVTVNGETFGYYITYKGKIYEFCCVSYDGSASGSVTIDPTDPNGTYSMTCVYEPHTHDYRIGYNRFYHWDACACGSIRSQGKHVDPATDEDSICTCGYKFSNNAELVTLWLSDMVLSPRFVKTTTEYNAAVHTYKEVTSSSISYSTFDALATVEAPATVSIQEGMNVIEVTVTAEDRKTTQTYTVYANKASKADGIVVSSVVDGDGKCTVILTPNAKMHRSTASLSISAAVGEKMAIQAENTDSNKVVLEPIYSKWSIKTVEVAMPSSVLTALSETKADLVIKTFSGNIVIPNAELENIAKEGENLLFSLNKAEDEVTLTLTADEKEVKNAKITLEPAEK